VFCFIMGDWARKSRHHPGSIIYVSWYPLVWVHGPPLAVPKGMRPRRDHVAAFPGRSRCSRGGRALCCPVSACPCPGPCPSRPWCSRGTKPQTKDEAKKATDDKHTDVKNQAWDPISGVFLKRCACVNNHSPDPPAQLSPPVTPPRPRKGGQRGTTAPPPSPSGGESRWEGNRSRLAMWLWVPFAVCW